MCGPILLDCFNLDKYLLPLVDIKLALFPSKPSFNLIGHPASTKQWKVEITDCSLMLCSVTASAHMVVAHNDLLSRGIPAVYPYTRLESRKLTLSKGINSQTFDDIWNGGVPTQVIIALVDNSAANGNYSLNPFNYENFDLNHLSLSLNGEAIPSKPLKPVYGDSAYKSHYIESYLGLFKGERDDPLKDTIDITREDFYDGYCIYRFFLEAELTDAKENSGVFPTKKSGNMRLDVCFSKALPKAVDIIVLGYFPSVMKIDQYRTVMVSNY